MTKSLYFYISFAVIFSPLAMSQGMVEFNTDFINGENKQPKVLQSLSGIIEGKYFAQVSVNEKSKGRHAFYISKQEEQDDKLCLDNEFLSLIELHLTPKAKKNVLSDDNCVDLSRLDFAEIDFDITKPALTISVPQKYILQQVQSQEYDRGINGAKLGYSLNGNVSNTNGDNAFGAFDAQVNLSGWILRSNITSALGYKRGLDTNITTASATYALPELNSDLMIGKGFTNGQVINGFSYGGASLSSNQAMYAKVSDNYIPDISGIVNSHSTITVRQKGRLLYSEAISPGPYKINNFSIYGSGDLEVTIVGAKGEIESKTYPVVVTSSLLREDSFDYELVIGKRFDQSGISGMFDSDRSFFFAEGRYGLTEMTLSGAALVDNRFQSFGFGTTFYLERLGTLALESEVTRATYSTGNQQTGFSFGVEYDYLFSDETSIQLAVFQYKDKDYVPYSNFNPDDNTVSLEQQKNRIQIAMNTELFGINTTLQAWYQGYWDTKISTIGSSLNLNRTFVNGVSANLALNYSKDRNNNDFSTTLLFSFPFYFDDNSHFVSSSVTRNTSEDLAFSSSFYGNLGHNVNYAASAGDYGVNANINYFNEAAQLSYGASYSKGNSSVSANVSGSLIWTQPTGVVATRSRSETVAIIDTQGVEKIRINGVGTNDDGYTSLSAVPYKNNSIKVDVTSVPIDTEVDGATQVISPSEGAIILRKIKTNLVYRYTFRVKGRQGEKMDSGDMYAGGIYLGAIAPNGIATVALTERSSSVEVITNGEKCIIDISRAQANVAKMLEVVCE